MPNLQFGTGGIFFQPSNANANLLTDLTPRSPALLQEVSVEFKADQKSLFGRKQMPAAVARGKVTTSGKCKLASQDALLWNALYFGMPTSTSGARISDSEQHSLNASTLATVTVLNTPFAVDYGVTNGSTGIPMQKITSGSPTENQYSVNTSTGVYTFSSSETATSVILSYAFTSTTGVGFTISSQNMGYAPTFLMVMRNTFEGKEFVLTLNSCTMTDISIPSKQDDFWVSDCSFGIQADAAGNLGSFYADQ